ncbi:DUF2061 domain-containing protein [Nonlabens xiamenensis]|uniref:DUF2061 domain-containing protein n=1 Tax=Nonlabens xiamenensis TaxID=2341043 RepID=UPI000F61287C|nr:DUF2061 domain-containing protein [Nonlabens xiamenensis]
MEVSKKRHIAKTITWRIIASVTTFILAYLFFKEDPDAATKATGVALAETVIKMVLYYFHERAWYKSNFGIKNRADKS